MAYYFEKMNGLGNDFIIFDKRKQEVTLSPQDMRVLADRKGCYGCDQIIIIDKDTKADAFMHIYNADGSQAEACGNALRCVAHKLLQEKKSNSVYIRTLRDILHCKTTETELSVKADMGEPQLDWHAIPLSHQQDTSYLTYDFYDGDTKIPLPQAAAVSMGNPHCIFFLQKGQICDLKKYGPIIEHDSLFPQRTNVNFATVQDSAHIRLHVWERGAGITQACGSGACATAVAAIRRGLCDRHVQVSLPGGDIIVSWQQDNNRVYQTAPVVYEAGGVFVSPMS